MEISLSSQTTLISQLCLDLIVNISLPDLCFIPTFLFFLTISFLLASYILTHIQNMIGIIATIIVCVVQPLSYAAVGLSDPGIVHEKESLKSERKR